jgi:hypothetical protein
MEAELTVSVLENFPALIWRDRSSQVFTEGAELEFSIQVTAEVSRENHAASHFELRVSQVLDANPSSDAEENHNRPSKTFVRKALKERESRAKPANYIYKDGNPAGR